MHDFVMRRFLLLSPKHENFVLEMLAHRMLYLVRGMLYLVRGMLYLVRGMLYLVRGMLYFVRGMLYLVRGMLYFVLDSAVDFGRHERPCLANQYASHQHTAS